MTYSDYLRNFFTTRCDVSHAPRANGSVAAERPKKATLLEGTMFDAHRRPNRLATAGLVDRSHLGGVAALLVRLSAQYFEFYRAFRGG